MKESQIKLEIQHIFDSGANELRVFEMIERLLKPKPGLLKLELDLQSPYNPDGSPRTDLPTGEVLGWNGRQWTSGKLNIRSNGNVWLLDTETYGYVQLQNVVRFAPLPTIIEEDGN